MTKLFLLTLFIVSAAFASLGQEAKSAEPQTTPQPAVQDARGQMMREIGLTPEQFRQMRRMNMERRPLMEAAQAKLREANRLLDEAIYADAVNEAEIETRLKAAQAAQAEVFRIRSANELAIRKILTPEQLVHFRELRQRFEAARQEMQNRRLENRKGDPAGNTFRDGKRTRPFVKNQSNDKRP